MTAGFLPFKCWSSVLVAEARRVRSCRNFISDELASLWSSPQATTAHWRTEFRVSPSTRAEGFLWRYLRYKELCVTLGILSAGELAMNLKKVLYAYVNK